MNKNLQLSLALICSTALPGTLAAQGVKSNQLISWSTTGVNQPGVLQLQDVDNRCRPETTACKNVLTTQMAVGAGGTAYDPRHQSVWVSEGTSLVEYDIRSCRAICKVKPTLVNARAAVTGLAIADSTSTLYVLESLPGHVAITPYNIARCPPVAGKSCSMKINNPRGVAAGLAYDEANKLLYVAFSEPAFVGFINTVFVTDAKSPCTVICRFSPAACDVRSQRMYTGLAYDACSKKLYVTEGSRTRITKVTNPRKCQFTDGACCNKTGSAMSRGLAIVPGWEQKSIGSSCVSKGCPLCRSMLNSISGGDPSLGNKTFALDLAGAPIQSFGLPWIGIGACSQGVKIPVLCGLFYPRIGPLLFPGFAMPANGRTQCRASIRMPFPIPVARVLCGLRICTQWLVLCNGGALGLSNAHEFTIASS